MLRNPSIPGGEAAIWPVVSPGADQLMLKHYDAAYLARRPDLSVKIADMIQNPPHDPLAPDDLMLAWPLEVVHSSSGKMCGFLMRRIPGEICEWHHISHPDDRRRPGGPVPMWATEFESWQRRVGCAKNLASAVATVHEAGYVIGDHHARNILVRRTALVALVDCDSFQVPRSNGGLPHLCHLGYPEVLAPELLGEPLSTTVRKPSADLFSLAIHIYQLLLEGAHPFTGIWSGLGEKPPVGDLAKTGQYAHSPGSPLSPSVAAPPFSILPPSVRSRFEEAFVHGARDPRRRPTAARWWSELESLSMSLVQCPRDPVHWYSAHLSDCPWCARSRRFGRTRPVAGKQSTSPSSAAHPPSPRTSGAMMKSPSTTTPSTSGAHVSVPSKAPPIAAPKGGVIGLPHGSHPQWRLEQSTAKVLDRLDATLINWARRLRIVK